jgi:hypothetical protein
MQEELDTGKVFAVGGVDYIAKPYRANEVLARVETHLALRRRNYELELLSRVGRELTAMLNLQRIAEQIQEAVTEVMDAMGTSVWLIDQDNEEWLECQVAFMRGLDQISSDLRVRSGQGVVGWVMEQGESVLVNNPADDPRFFAGIDEETGFITRSLLAVPLRARDRVIGVLEVVNKQSGGFSPNDLILVETIAASAAIAIDNTWLFEALSQHAMDLETTNGQLQEAVNKVKLLTGLLPICSHCKKIRNDLGYWEQVEVYISEHSLAEFSHGMGPECVQTHYPELYEKLVARRRAILDVLRQGRATLPQIAAAVNLPESNTENRLQDMQEEGLINQIVELNGQTFYELSPNQP